VPQDHCEWQFPSGRKDLFDRFLGYGLALFPGTGAGRKQNLTVGRLRFVPVGFSHDRKQSLPGRFGPGQCLCVAAEAVILGIGTDLGPDTVKINVGRHGLDHPVLGFNQDARKTIGPKRAKPVVPMVEPNTEVLFEHLHESRDITHLGQLAPAPELSLRGVRLQIGLDDLQSEDAVFRGLGIEHLVAPQQFFIAEGLGLGNPDQDVEMIGEDGPGQDLHPAVVGHGPELPTEILLIHRIKQPFPVNCPADAVIHSFRLLWLDFDPSCSHAHSLAQKSARFRFFNPSLSVARKSISDVT